LPNRMVKMPSMPEHASSEDKRRLLDRDSRASDSCDDHQVRPRTLWGFVAGKFFATRKIEALLKECDKLAEASCEDAQKYASVLQKLAVYYYEDVRWQALLAFFAAFILEIVAVGFFFWAGIRAINDGLEAALFSSVSGLLIQFMTAIVFYLYSQSSSQFGGFHICLERTNRFLMANAMAEQIQDEDKRNSKRGEVITAMLNAPMLTQEAIFGGARFSMLAWGAHRSPPRE